MVKQNKAYFCASAAVLFWSTAASAFKIALRHLEVPVLLFYASFVSTIALFLYLAYSRKLVLLKALTRKDYLRSAMLGFLNPFLYYTVLLYAYSMLPAQQAQPINFVWPIVLVLLSIPLLKQKIRPRDILALFISFIGVFIISTQGDVLGFRFTSFPGVLLALGSTVIWALFWIYNVKDARDEVVRLFLNFAFGCAFVFLSMLLFARMKHPNLNGFCGAAYIGLFEMGITYLLWLRALKLSQTTAHVTSLVYLVPFLSLILISFVVPEIILFSTVIGLILIIGGIILQKL